MHQGQELYKNILNILDGERTFTEYLLSAKHLINIITHISQRSYEALLLTPFY